MPSGGFSYWPDKNYAMIGVPLRGHFLLEPRKRYVSAELDLIFPGYSYQQNMAGQWRSGPSFSDLTHGHLPIVYPGPSGNADIASDEQSKGNDQSVQRGKIPLGSYLRTLLVRRVCWPKQLIKISKILIFRE